MLYYTNYDSPLGSILMLASEKALMGLWLPGQTIDQERLAQACRRDSAPMLEQGRSWLDRYFCGQRPTPQEIPLDPQGSDFRRAVWHRLCRIPYGQLETYGQIAREMAEPKGGKMSAQAVGGAVGHNPIALIIPCHRVIGANGNLVGYGGGLALKKRILQYEGVDIRDLHDPKRKRNQ
ncbi:methylated-DNA--[protein]-cysteine S-methyltransferase [Subdoligranulum variabile]|nr:methylated-DNA--[protein]-cysteine S-methyltransferase [Subdoligranulum variabile]UWP68043.1 methylated-DNA--[protein]-cysteine S-methyltransferase [Subdoligranulum variabile]